MQLKYQAVLTDIQSKIISGLWPENSMIPTELELCSIYKVSRITIRRALDELTQTGLIIRIRGKGTFVRQVKQYNDSFAIDFGENETEKKNKIFNKILTYIEYPSDSDLVRNMLPQFKLSQESGETISRIHVVRSVRDIPYAVMNLFLLTSTAKKIDKEKLAYSTLLEMYKDVEGKEITTVQRSFSAVIPDSYTSQLLRTKPGSAHLWMKSVALVDPDRPVAINYAVYDGNIFNFTMTFNTRNQSKVIM
ncbi:MAG: GntR family transcriptional regulator [Sphaerochaetaceae bacterium]|nr:GntR family transcriptional regulator [Sphaerochaetaceae bacterium]